jgi:branched-chain amino acid transport system ATP-binding protein
MRAELSIPFTQSSALFNGSMPAVVSARTKGQKHTMLRLNNIEVIYSDVILVLKGLSLEVPQGQIVALLGANGAGKTTTLKAISGLLKTENGRVTSGSVELMSQRIDGMDPDRICRLGVLQVMEGRKVLESLTVEENLHIGGYTRRDPDGVERDFQMIYDYFPRLVERRHQLAGYLSGGEQQMLVIGRALMAQPKLLLLDEPSLGLAPLLVREIFGIIQKINAEHGTTFLLVEQNAQIALNIAHYGYIMENGRIVLDGPAEMLRGNEDVREFYLGLSEAGRRKSFKDIKFYKRRKRWVF